MKIFDRTINVILLLATLWMLAFIMYAFHHQVVIPNRPIIKMTSLAKHGETGKTIAQLGNYGKRPVSDSNVQLMFVPFEGNNPLRDEEIVVSSTLFDLGAGEIETVGFDLLFSDERFEGYKVFFVIMSIEDDELLEGFVTDIWYRYAFEGPWVPLRSNSAFVDDKQEAAIKTIAETINKRSGRFAFHFDWMVFWTAAGVIGIIAIAFLAGRYIELRRHDT